MAPTKIFLPPPLRGWGSLRFANPSLLFSVAPLRSRDEPQHHPAVGAQPGSSGGSSRRFELGEWETERVGLGMVLEGSLGTGDSSWAGGSRVAVCPPAEPVPPAAGGCRYGRFGSVFASVPRARPPQ